MAQYRGIFGKQRDNDGTDDAAVIGLPRAVFHFFHPQLWETFFRELGWTAVLSAPTVSTTLERAGLISETEHCLPVKILDAHLDDLADRVPRVFVPRVLSLQKGFISCPKLAALPDAVRAQFGDRVEVVSVDLDENRRSLEHGLHRLGASLGQPRRRVRPAARAALAAMRQAQARAPSRSASGTGKPFLLVGHPYNLDEPYLAEPIARKLAALGASVERLSFDHAVAKRGALQWDTCAGMHEALEALDPDRCAGVIHLSSFNCGCDSMAAVYFRETLQRKGIPYMTVTLDTHAALAGLATRLEAFADSIGAGGEP